MINVSQLRTYIIRPVLQELGLWSRSAEDLLIGTAAQESHDGDYLRQLGNGPARGLYQMEEPTYNDTINRTKPSIIRLAGQYRIPTMGGFDQLEGNLYWATALCRMKYYLVNSDLPTAGDIQGYANYWKTHWNSKLGQGTVEQFIKNYNIIVGAS